MTAVARFVPAAGTLVLDEDAFEALVVAAAGRAPADDEVAALLARAGALVEGRPHRALDPGLGAILAPVCRLTLERGPRRARGWVGERHATVLVPAGPELVELVPLPTRFVPDALARLNDLGPRAGREAAPRLRLAAGELAELLAGGQGPPGWRLAGEERRVAAQGLVDGLREHWRVEARWRPSPSSPGVRSLEVVDTDGGLWRVVPDGADVELWPASPTEAWRELTALLPRDDELAEPEAS